MVITNCVSPAASTSSSSPRFRGVRKRSWGSWVSEIRMPHSRQRIWLGSFATALQAARAYDAAAVCLRGPSASRNFPAELPISQISLSDVTKKDIQSIAAAAAAAAVTTDSSTSLSVSIPSSKSNEQQFICYSSPSSSSLFDFTDRGIENTSSSRLASELPNCYEMLCDFDDIFDGSKDLEELPRPIATHW